MRTWTEIVKPYPKLLTGRSYRARVKEIIKVSHPKAVAVDLELLQLPQRGRRLRVLLPLPIRPNSLAASFFNACGMPVIPGAKLTPHSAVSASVNVRFEEKENDRYEPIDFKSDQKGEHHEPAQCQ